MASVATKTEKPGAEQRGRPTSYRPQMCDRIKELAREGAGFAEMAADIGISLETWRDWQDKESPRYNPIFSEAVKEARGLSLAWWEKQGRVSTFAAGPNFNATSYIFQMKNRFREEWSDRVVQDQNVTGAVKIQWGKGDDDSNPAV